MSTPKTSTLFLEPKEFKPHKWIPSTLGHGESMCSKCFITNREAAVLNLMNFCEKYDG